MISKTHKNILSVLGASIIPGAAGSLLSVALNYSKITVEVPVVKQSSSIPFKESELNPEDPSDIKK